MDEHGSINGGSIAMEMRRAYRSNVAADEASKATDGVAAVTGGL